MRFVFLTCAALFLCTTTTMAAEMPSYSTVRKDMDEAIHRQMSEKGIVNDRNVNWLVRRIRAVYSNLGDVYVIQSDDVSLSPSNIYIGTDIVEKASNGALTGIILCGMDVLERGGVEERYNQVARTVNVFAMGSKNDPNSKENIKILQDIANKVFSVVDDGALKNGDNFACRSLPNLGYPASDYIDFLKSRGGIGLGKLSRFMTNLPDRVASLEKGGPWPQVKEVAPKSEKEEVIKQVGDKLQFTERIKEIDPEPFLPVLSGEPVAGYCSGEISPGVFLLFNRPGKVEKRSKGGFIKNYVLNDGSDQRTSVDQYFLDSGKGGKDKATEGVLLARNPNTLSTCFLIVRVGYELGTSGLPDKYRTKNENLEPTSGDWPYRKYVAVKFKVDDLPRGETMFSFILGKFLKPGNEEGQYTSHSRSERPVLQTRPIFLIR